MHFSRMVFVIAYVNIHLAPKAVVGWFTKRINSSEATGRDGAGKQSIQGFSLVNTYLCFMITIVS